MNENFAKNAAVHFIMRSLKVENREKERGGGGGIMQII